MGPRAALLVVVKFFCLVLPLGTKAQKTVYEQGTFSEVEGQFIVQVTEDNDIRTFLSQFASARTSAFSEAVESRQLMSSPLNLWLLTCNKSQVSHTAFSAMLRRHNGFIHVSPNRRLNTRKIPDDPEFTKQWQYLNTGSTGGIAGADNDMDLAWDITTGGLTPAGDTIVICVIDDGVNINHEDMKANLWVNRHEIPGNNIDDDNNGYTDDYLGWNALKSNDTIFTDGGHGTPVAGIIGARGNNGIGVSGVNWNVKLMIVDYGSATEANALAAYGYAYTMRKLYNETNGAKGAFVVATNASWGVDDTKAEEAPLWCSLFDALGKIGILNCGATTNNDTDVDVKGDLPTSCTSDYLISVTNLNKSDAKVTSAGYGRISIDLGSYGQQAYTVTRTGYGFFGGTSGATPHVTGVIGLLYSTPCSVFSDLVKNQPDKAALVARDMILHGVSPLPGLQGITTTGGKLNAFRAVSNVMKMCESCSAPAGIKLVTTDSTASVSWHTEAGTSEVSVRYRQANETNWTLIKDFVNGQTIDGLEFCTNYELQVGSSCGFLPGNFSYSKFFKTTGCCNKPDVNVAQSGNDHIVLTWSSDQEASYLLRYRVRNNPWQDTIISGTAFTLPGLDECTAATFSLRASCLKYGNESEYTDELIGATDCGNCTKRSYCIPKKTDATQEWISYFRLDTISHSSVSNDLGYENFAGVADFMLEAGKKYNFKVTIGYAGTAFKDYVRVYLDLDQDGEWDDNEAVYVTQSPVSDSIKGVLSVPVDVAVGWTRLRVILTYEDFEGGCYDSVFEYGETEDYCIRIREACSNDLVTQAIAESGSSVRITHHTSAKADTVQLRYRASGTTEWILRTLTDTSEVISELDSCTWYQYQLRRQCDTTGYSAWSSLDSVRTDCRNQTIDVEFPFVVTPNPASSFFEISDPQGHLLRLHIIRADGIKMMESGFIFAERHHKIPIENLPPGMYILKAESRNRTVYTGKLVKL